ncbi:MAG: hypothetical protein OES79_02375 [Planctomycetota bacterium]|nr:hypothetical protein [Planctomycetota bacterium]
MYRSTIYLLAACLILITAVPSFANDYLAGGMFSTPAVTHFRVAAAPVYAPAPYAAYRPVYAQPVVAYSPVIAAPIPQSAPVTYASPIAQPIPVTAYSPVMTPAPVMAARPVVVARPVVSRTKFYVPGQPIRNVFRWVGPGVPTGVAVMP